MYTRRFWIDQIPLIAMARRPGGPYPGTVLLYHGLKASKETHLKELEQLAERGFLAIGVDAHGHGERALPDLSAFMAEGGDFHGNFLKLVRPTVAEIPHLLARLASMEQTGPVAVMGISMGGYVAFAAPLVCPRLATVVPILGSPVWEGSQDSPHLRPEAFAQVALLAWNAGRDVNVPPGPAREFVARIGKEYMEYAESDHFMRPEDWHDGWRRTLEWLERYLSGT